MHCSRRGRAAVIPEPTYGAQLQDVAVPGLAAEGRIRITRTEREVVFKDGTEMFLERSRATRSSIPGTVRWTRNS